MLKPKYKVGQKVWFIAAHVEDVVVGNKIEKEQMEVKGDEVLGVWIDAEQVGYHLKGMDKMVAERVLYATKKAAEEAIENEEGFALPV